MDKDFWKGFLMMLGIWFVYPMVFIWIIENSDSIFSQIVLMGVGLVLIGYFLEWLKGKVN